jgi:hypothetical protein
VGTRSHKPRVLVLYWNPPGNTLRGAILDHLRALEHIQHPPDVLYVNAWDGGPRWLDRVRPDAIVLHTTFLCVRWSHLFPTWKWSLRWIADLDCPKVALPQDEYDHAHVLDEWLAELGVDLVVSNFDATARASLYPSQAGGATFVHGFTGYIDEAAAERLAPTLLPHVERPLDIVYRASHLPYWFGSQGQLKHLVGSVVGDAATSVGMAVDVSTRYEDTILGAGWLSFLASGRVVLGCESGSSVLDRRGEVRAALQAMLATEPELTFEAASARMPPGWDDYRYFALSPRHLEAVVTKTCQLLVEGHYEGVLEAGRHYVALRRDFSNLQDALAEISDPRRSQEIAEAAYEDVYLSGRYGQSVLGNLVLEQLDLAPGSAAPHPAWSVVSRSKLADTTAWQASEPRAPRSRRRLRRPHLPPIRSTARAVVRRLGAPLLTAQLVATQGLALLRRKDLRTIMFDLVRERPFDPNTTNDLLRLAIVANARRGRLQFTIDTSWDPAAQRLVFRSRTAETVTSAPELPVDVPRDFSHAVWDHSAVAEHVNCKLLGSRSVSVSVGTAGIYPFPAIQERLSASPHARDALFAFARNGGGAQ